MRLLILGSNGMLGLQLVDYISKWHSVYAQKNRFPFDAKYPWTLTDLFVNYHPEAVINAVGVIPQKSLSTLNMLEVNAVFPHKLAMICRIAKARLIHISTDCVFSGKGPVPEYDDYNETGAPDPDDIYGRTKLLGEITNDTNCLTIRTSFIGRELEWPHFGLLEWFRTSIGTIDGFKNVIFSGLTTLEISRVIQKILDRPDIRGLYHVSGDPISKYDLLMKLRPKFNPNLDIVPVDEPHINRSLDSTKFRKELNYKPPTWDEMIEEL